MQQDREQVTFLMSSVTGLRRLMPFNTNQPGGSVVTSWALDLVAGALIYGIMLVAGVLSVLDVFRKPGQLADLPKHRRAPQLPLHEWALEDMDDDV